MPSKIQAGGASLQIRTMSEAGSWLENVRTVTGKTKAEFARFIGTSPQNYQHIINGKAYPRFEMIAVLKYHGFNVDDLLSVKGVK